MFTQIFSSGKSTRSFISCRQNDMFGVLFDTFHDRRNGYNFYTNPLGGFTDQLVTDEGNPNADWNPVWNLVAGRFDGGWTIEAAIPFKSIRYGSGAEQRWGFQVRRINRWRNEVSFLTPMFRGTGNRGIFMASQYATLTGIQPPSGSRTTRLSLPYSDGMISPLTW